MREREYTELFERLCRAKGWTFKRSTKNDDMRNHVDGYVTIYNGNRAVRTFSVDLKGDKYNSRRNNGVKDCLCQYVEFLNVNGDKGWLFGKAEYIAVLNEDLNGFYLISRVDIITFCEKLFSVDLSGTIGEIRHCLDDLNCWTESVEMSMHKLYRRHDRPDEIVTQIDYNDIQILCKIKI